MRTRSAIALSVTLALAGRTASAQLQVVIPNGAGNAPGNGSNAFPWGTAASTWPGLRLMAVYDALNFTNQNVGFPILITELKWRPDNSAGAVAGGQFAQAIVELSTSPTGWAAITTNYTTNHGSDRTVVYDAVVDGPVIHTPTPGNGAWTPQSWCVDIQLATPFLYDPSQGDLVIDVDYPTGSFSGGNVGQMDVQNSLAGRVFASSMYPVANGTTANHGPVVEVGYVPASGLYAIFGSDVQTGSSPLTVTFQDNSYSSDPGGVTSWAWDFDNDGTVDSTLQNPVHTYTACGVYDVKLTVGDASHSPSSVTRTAFIRTDDITAAFDDQVVGALAMQFSDRSSGPATAWTWDLDGDGITDSTLPNPTWAYPNHDPVDVTLTASRLCGGSDTITRTIVPALAIQTTFAGGATGAAGSTMLFDVDVTNPLGVKVTGLDVHVAGGSGVGFSVEVHLTSAGHAGKETVADAWLLAGTATGTTAGAGVRTTMNLGAPIYLPPGHYGMALHHLGAAPAFTVGTGSNQDYHGADLALHLGTHRSTAPNQPFGAGASTAARVWNGALRYQRCQLSGAGGYGFLGEGCAGSLGVPRLTPINDPRLGQTLQVMVDRLPAMTALMFTGVSSSTSPLGPLPLDTTALGAPGCFLRASPDVGLLISGASSTAQWNLAIPSSPALACALFFQQAVVFDPGHNAAGAVASNAAGFVVGN